MVALEGNVVDGELLTLQVLWHVLALLSQFITQPL
jgi:hypothetical protein